MNKVIKLLILSDIFVITGFGLISPIFAIFIKDSLIGGTIFSAGVASTIYLITKSCLQLPFSRYADSHDDKKYWLIVGTFFIAAVPFIYIFAKNIYTIYFAQFVYGIGSGLAFPTWLSIFSTHLDKKHEGFEWSIYSTLVSIGTAISAAIGAAIAQFLGFNITFMMVGAMAVIGCLILFMLDRKGSESKQNYVHHYHKMKILHRHNH